MSREILKKAFLFQAFKAELCHKIWSQKGQNQLKIPKERGQHVYISMKGSQLKQNLKNMITA